MSVKIRLTRLGAKKRPFYRLVVANVRAPRDGKFIEVLGHYNPMLTATELNQKVVLKKDRIDYWLSQGAQMTDKVAKMLFGAGVNIPKKLVPNSAAFNKKVEKKAAKA